MLPNILALVYWERKRPQRKKILRSCAISIFEPPLVRNSLACFKSIDASSWSHLLLLRNCCWWGSPIKCGNASKIFILSFRRNIDEKEVAFQKSWRLCGSHSARKVGRDFLENWWASTHPLWMEITDLLKCFLNGSLHRKEQLPKTNHILWFVCPNTNLVEIEFLTHLVS